MAAFAEFGMRSFRELSDPIEKCLHEIRRAIFLYGVCERIPRHGTCDYIGIEAKNDVCEGLCSLIFLVCSPYNV